ncbi:hypothetical protein YC2023_051500 [Brassica napus]
MLLLVESILLPKNNKGTFPLEYVNKAKDMMYPWGRDAYLLSQTTWRILQNSSCKVIL